MPAISMNKYIEIVCSAYDELRDNGEEVDLVDKIIWAES